MSFLSSFNVSPRQGHLEAAYRVFEYLYSHKNGGCVVFDDAKPKVNEKQFKEVSWKKIFGDMIEDISTYMPELRETNVMIILMFTNTTFAEDLVTRRLQSDILIFLNGAPIT